MNATSGRWIQRGKRTRLGGSHELAPCAVDPLEVLGRGESGMMHKTWIMSEIEMVSGRPVARRMEISDQLKQDSRTVFSLEEVSFGVELESKVFTRRWLERR